MRIPVARIVALAGVVFGVSPEDIQSPRRKRALVLVRHAVFRLARGLSGLSYPQIGQRIGGRDHSTVIHGAAQCIERMRADPLYAARVRRLRKLALRSAAVPGLARLEAVRPPIDWQRFAAEIDQRAEPRAAAATALPRRLPGDWWEQSDDDLLSEAVRAHYAAGGDCLEVWG